MNSINFDYKKLEKFCTDAFIGFGFSETEAKQITDVLLLADLYGIESHGLQRLSRYHTFIKNGLIKVDGKPEVVFETPVSAVIDGHAGMGQVISVFATELAIKKAKQSGIAFVSVRNSNHYGIAGYYTKMAVEKGFMAFSTTNTEPIAVPTNSRETLLGTNPIAFAMPAEPYNFWYDAATTVVSRGKLEVYNKENKDLTHGWAVGQDGQVSLNPKEVLDCIANKLGVGGILPLGGSNEITGGHKGYGLSVMCDLLSASVSGGVTSNHHVRIPGKGAEICHSFIVIDPAIFGDPEEIKKNASKFLKELRDSKRVDENVPVLTHGEKEVYMTEAVLKNGVDININTVKEMVDVCHDLNMDVKEYLGDLSEYGLA